MYCGKLSKEIRKKMDKYEKKFNDIFPLMLFDGTEEELEKELNDCIAKNEKYDISFWLDNDCES